MYSANCVPIAYRSKVESSPFTAIVVTRIAQYYGAGLGRLAVGYSIAKYNLTATSEQT